MAIVTLHQLHYTQGGVRVLDGVDLSIEAAERIVLIGRNGTGKSTLMQLIAGVLQPESGRVEKQKNIDIVLLSQALLPPSERTVYEALSDGLAHIGILLKQYHALSQEQDWDDKKLNRLAELQHQLDEQQGWHLQQRIEKLLTTFALPADARLSQLSGGWLRRVAIAQALIREPDLLLLDEPTNHLDLDTIEWLENLLLEYPKSILMVTHDRTLMHRFGTRIIELDRGKLSTYPGNYAIYLERKEKALQDEEKQNALFDKKLSQEEVWIRQGIQARRTRNEGRVRNLEKLRLERQARREVAGKPNIQLQATASESKIVIRAQNITFSHPGQKPLFKPFSVRIQKGEKWALVGPNGIGKSTLINVLVGELPPTSGEVKHSASHTIAFFDQKRMQIDPYKTAIENVIEGSDVLEINGKKKHVISYLGDFLFSPDKARSEARFLSGGETNRLLLAKLFSKPANVLVLDEPTNDLDVESLEVLESILQSYEGTVILITHDRTLIDNVATHSLFFEGDGILTVYAGGYTDSQAQRALLVKKTVEPTPTKVTASSAPKSNSNKECLKLMDKIEKIEKVIAGLHEKLADPNFYQQPADQQEIVLRKLKEQEILLENAYIELEKW